MHLHKTVHITLTSIQKFAYFVQRNQWRNVITYKHRCVNTDINLRLSNESSLFPACCSRSHGGFRLTTVNLVIIVIDVHIQIVIVQIQHMICRSAKHLNSTYLRFIIECATVKCSRSEIRLVSVNRFFRTELNELKTI